MPKTQTKPITLDRFLALPETKPASEYVTGNIVQKPMPQGKHSLLKCRLLIHLNSIFKESKIALSFPGLRCTFGDRSIVPDVVVLKNENIPRDENGEIANVVSTHPDLTIEILSPDQSTTKVIANIIHCLDNGTEVGWLIDPAERMIMVYRPDRQVQIIEQLDSELIVTEFASMVKLTAGNVFNWLRLE